MKSIQPSLLSRFILAFLSPLALCTACSQSQAVTSTPLTINVTNKKGSFPLANSTKGAPIIVENGNAEVVKIAAKCLSEDIQKVTGFQPIVSNSVPAATTNVVLIGTLGSSPIVDSLVESRKLDVSGIRGQWESFTVTTVNNPMPGVQQALVLAGSGRRGTAYAAFTLSQAIGVSPWNWWADVKPQHKNELWINAEAFVQPSPDVKYRGIFINDEDWGLQPWAAKTFEPETKDIGPKTYAKVCELLLRLKANYLWPAMHESTKAFNIYPDNKAVADRYAIVMGSSHAEPMLRNNVSEWDHKTMGDWNYDTNRDGVLKYWEQRVRENGKYENIFTLGMRGIHDSSMPGGGSTADKVARLQKVLGDQREMLAREVNPNVEKVPQSLVPYKEVLTLYQNGLVVPDDVTLVWPDDNHGYIRQLSTPEEQKRSGGSGVYYHLSYWGEPLDYLWLDTTPPALMQSEMTKAYDYGARTIWVVNVGDIKPQEVGADLFLELAWDVDSGRKLTQLQMLTRWASRTFGAQHATEIGALLDEYYKLNSVVRPEHLNVDRSGFSFFDIGDEAQTRLERFTKLASKTDSLYSRISPDLKDAFYQLLVYRIRGAALMNEKVLNAERSRLYATQGRASTNLYAAKAQLAFNQIAAETKYYNTTLAGGKWAYMMYDHPRDLKYFGMPKVGQIQPSEGSGLGIAVEASPTAVSEDEDGGLQNFNSWTRRQQFVDVFNTGKTPLEWKAVTSDPWIKLSQTSGTTPDETRIFVSVDWDKAPRVERGAGTITFTGAGATRRVTVPTYRPQITGANTFRSTVQNAGMAAVEAENFTRTTTVGGASWKRMIGLGRDSDAVTIFPTTAPSIEPNEEALKGAPSLQYDVEFFTPGPAVVSVFCSPTQRIHQGRGVRYAIAINDEKSQFVDLQADEYSGKWRDNILRNASIGKSVVNVAKPGTQTIKIWMIDPGVVLDKIVLSVGEPRSSFVGPPETPNKNIAR